MSAIMHAASRKMQLLRVMEHQAEEFTVRLLRQLRPAFHASLDYSALAQAKNTLEYAARHMCEIFYDDKFNAEKNNEKYIQFEKITGRHNALTTKIEQNYYHWGFSGFEFLGLGAAETSVILQFNSHILQKRISEVIKDFPKSQIRFNLFSNSRNYFFLSGIYISPYNLIDISYIERVIPIWGQWIDESSIWLKS